MKRTWRAILALTLVCVVALTAAARALGSKALPLTLTAPEVGEVLGISRAAAYELVRSKGFPHIRIGTRILVPKDKFIQWIDQQTEVDG